MRCRCTPVLPSLSSSGSPSLNTLGWQNLRVRSEGDTARIELPLEQIKEFVLTTDLQKVVSAFQDFGFIYVTLDLEGYRSDKLNQILNREALSVKL